MGNVGDTGRGRRKGSGIWGNLIRVRSHRYGTLKLRGLTVGDVEFIEKLLDLNIAPRDFAVRLIQHQLSSPQLPVEEVQAWSDKLLIRTIFSWAKHNEAIEQHMPEDMEPFEAFRSAVACYREEQNKRLRLVLGRTIDTVHTSSLLFSTNQLNQIIGSQALDFARSGHNAIAEIVNATRPLNRFVEQINAIPPGWIDQIRPTQEILGSFTVPNQFIRSDLAEISKFSTLAESSLNNLRWVDVGSALRIPDYLSDLLKASFLDFSESYSNLYNSFHTSPDIILTYPPELSRLPAIEYFSGADLLEAISVEESEVEASEEKQQLREAILAESGDAIRSQLISIDADLVSLWEGAIYSLNSNNPDRVRHTATSLRELFTQVLHRLAPDKEVQKWSMAPEHYDDKGRPTRRARLLYICREINHGPFSTFVEKDVNAVLEFIQLFQRGTHEVVISYTQAQLIALKVRMESVIRFLIEISRQNK